MELAPFVPEGEARNLYIRRIEEQPLKPEVIEILAIYTSMSYQQIVDMEIKSWHDYYLKVLLHHLPLIWLFEMQDPDFLRYYISIRNVIKRTSDPFSLHICSMIDKEILREE